MNVDASISQRAGDGLVRRREVVIIGFLVGFSAAAAGLALTVGLPPGPCANTHGITRTFTIIADLDGFNGSRYQPSPWPEMSVSRCDTVVISLANRDAQTHGLTVEFYANNGIEAQAGQTLTLRFLATTTGQFRVFCHIPSTAHVFMQQGQLTVT